MSDDEKRSTSTTFKRSEVLATSELFKILLRGGDPKIVLRRPETLAVIRKFYGMRDRLG